MTLGFSPAINAALIALTFAAVSGPCAGGGTRDFAGALGDFAAGGALYLGNLRREDTTQYLCNWVNTKGYCNYAIVLKSQ